MRTLKLLAVMSLVLLVAPSAQAAHWGVEIGVGPAYVGPEPVCTYGYYDYYPYACAPYGYYGPDWFMGGIFIGTGPWFHHDHGYRGYYGRPGFYGHGFEHGQAFRDRGYYGRGPAFAGRGGYRGGYGDGGRSFHSGGGFHGGNGFHGGGGGYHGGGNGFHGGGNGFHGGGGNGFHGGGHGGGHR